LPPLNFIEVKKKSNISIRKHEPPMTWIKNQDTQGDDYKITKLKGPVLFPL
jgi:hypothetical protein